MSKGVGGALEDPSRKTVGELLTQLQKQAAEEKTEADRQKRLADEAKAKADATAAELRKSIELTVYDKGFIPSNPMGGRYSDQLTIRCAYHIRIIQRKTFGRFAAKSSLRIYSVPRFTHLS